MKIKNPNINNRSLLQTNQSKTDKVNLNSKKNAIKTPGIAQPRNDAAKVNLSTRAQQMQKAKAIASEPSFNADKVARLQKMIDDGTYKVDSAAVADRLVDNHLLFGE